MPEADWHAILGANLTGAFLAAQAVIPGMKRAGRGRIVLISSAAGLGISLTGIQAYAATKAGEIGLARQLAHELGPHGITVNTVAPGFVRSSPATERRWDSDGVEGRHRRRGAVSRQRPRGWVTGRCLAVDGGR